MQHEQRQRATVGIDGRQYTRKSTMHIDVLGFSSVSEAVHQASEMLRIGIVRAMSSNTDDDLNYSDNDDCQKVATERIAIQESQMAERDHASVYSAVSKRMRRLGSDTASHEPDAQSFPELSSKLIKPSFALRSWSAAKKAGPSILSKRGRQDGMSKSSRTEACGVSVFQPGPKRDRREDTNGRGRLETFLSPTEEELTGETFEHTDHLEKISSEIQKSAKGETLFETREAIPGNMMSASSSSSFTQSPAANVSKLAEQSMSRPGSIIEDRFRRKTSESRKAEQASLSSTPHKTGLSSSWYQVNAKSVNPTSRPASALALLRKPGTTKIGTLPAAPRGSSGIPTFSAAAKGGFGNLKQPPPNARRATEIHGVIPLPSSTGIQVNYVPGSETIDGVRPNGYTVSMQGVVKPVVTFNPKPKLPHKLRQNSVEKLFEAWRDNQKLAEGDALARALRTEQEMYARACSRADYRAAVTVKLRDIRKLDK